MGTGKEKRHEGPADDLVTSREVAKTPGKYTQDDGAGAPSMNLLTPTQRDEMMLNLKLRIVAAGARCNDALQALKIHQLIKKPEQMHWFFSLLIDVAFAQLTGWATRSILKLKTGQIGKYDRLAGQAAEAQDGAALDHADGRAAMFRSISDDTIRQRVAILGGFTKMRTVPIVAAALAEDAGQANAINYLAQLQRSMDIAFQTLGEEGVKGASDAELIVLFDAMDAVHHSSEVYERLFGEKLKRYQTSGVDRLGNSQEMIEGGSKRDWVGTRHLDRRVVWVTHEDNKTKSLWFYEMGHEELPAGHLHSVHNNRWRLTGLVPREFWEEAVMKSEAEHGEPVQTLQDTNATRAARGVRPDHAKNMSAAKVTAKNAPTDDEARVVRLFGGQ